MLRYFSTVARKTVNHSKQSVEKRLQYLEKREEELDKSILWLAIGQIVYICGNISSKF